MALNLPRLPVDIATFKRLREDNCLYVDKTRHAYNLIRGGYRFFLSRPRRFGKSLLVSMLKEIFLGNRKLFQGLWIDQSDYSWNQHGVIAFDLSSFDVSTIDVFKADMYRFLEDTAVSYELNVDINRTEGLGTALRVVVQALSKRFGRVAVLIDEYDSPVLRNLHDKEQAKAMRDVLHSFFSAIKGFDEYINFVFITGVSSFAKAGIFSGMNNLQIITTKEPYADLCGYTDKEITNYLSPHIEAWAQKESISFEEQRKQIKDWYNGYRFSSSAIAVYNPFSVMHALQDQRLGNFWFASGTPTFLVDELKKKQHEEPEVFNAIVQGEHIKISQDSLGVFDVGLTPIPALMFQTGYLTIVGYDKARDTYQLGYPNNEIRQSLQLYLLSIATKLNTETAKGMAFKLSTELDERGYLGLAVRRRFKKHA